MCFSVLLAHAPKINLINLWTLSSFPNSPMVLMMEFMYARLVDSAGLQEQQVFFHGHVITYSIYCIDVVPYTQVIHLNIPTTILFNVCSSSSILIVILTGKIFNHVIILLMFYVDAPTLKKSLFA